MQNTNTEKYNSWNESKKKISQRDLILNFFVKPRQVVWINLGKNIGDEEDGKNNFFERPVLVIKVFNKNLFWGIPMSTKIKDNNIYYKKVSMYFKNNLELEMESKEVSLILSQMRVFDTKRISKYIGYINKEDFENTKSAIRAFL